MHKLLTLLFSALCITTFGQTQLDYFDPGALYAETKNMEQEGEDSLALIQYLRVLPSDSVFNSAMTSAIYILVRQGKPESAIELADSILNNYTHSNIDRYYLLLNKGVAQIHHDTLTHTAIATFKEALKLYPANNLLYYNLGIAYQNADSIAKAMEMFQTCVALDPYYSAAHLKIGYLSYQENLIAQSVLAYSMVLVLEPNRSNAGDLLAFLDHLVSTKSSSEKKTAQLHNPENKAFEEINLIVNNYSALNKGYVIPTKLNTPFAKQFYAICDMLKDYESTEGFWSNFYVPFYQAAMNENLTTSLIARMHTSSNNAKVSKLAKKLANQQANLLKWVASTAVKSIAEGGSGFPYEEGKQLYRYSNGPLSSVGTQDAEGNSNGKWTFYYDNGGVSATGYFINSKKDSTWNWYNRNGNLIETGAMKDDNPEGLYTTYFDNGRIESLTNYANGEKQGEEILFNEYGGEKEWSNYKNGVISDSSEIYYNIGDTCKRYDLFYINGNLDGIAYEYFSSGEIYRQIAFSDGIRDGKEFLYYKNGQIAEETIYVDNVRTGESKSYYEDGTLKSAGRYSENGPLGEWTEYYPNGNVKTVTNYNNEGDLEGDYKNYTLSGKLHYAYVYDKSKIKEYSFFDTTGTVFYHQKIDKSNLTYQSFYIDGTRMSKGQYNTEREQDGLWFFYNQHGEVESSTEYTDGLKHGENTVYFADSSIKSQGIYVDDIEEGRYFENNIDGSLSYEVTYHNGAYSREERSYSQNQLTGKTYLLNGMKHGQDFDYDEKGRIHSIDIFDKGYAIKSTYFDTLGNVLSEIDQLSSGKHMRNFANGNKVFEGDYVNGYAHGHFTYYYSSGQIDSEGDYFNGKQNGIWKWYYRDGTLSAKGKYIDGERQGEWVSFNENGKPDWKSSYYNGERHGMYADYSYTGNICYQAEYTYGKRNHTADYFSPDGTLQMRKYYDNNICRAYTYTGKDGKLVPPVKVTSATQTYVTYFQSGDTARVLPIVNGEIHGTFKAFHPTGKLAEIESYHYGFRHGTSTEYYASGQIQSQAVYRYGKITGNKETFYENGQLESKIPYLGGLRSGKASYFSPNGEKVTDIIFVDDSEYDSY